MIAIILSMILIGSQLQHRTTYDWMLGLPTMTDNVNYEWVLGLPNVKIEMPSGQVIMIMIE